MPAADTSVPAETGEANLANLPKPRPISPLVTKVAAWDLNPTRSAPATESFPIGPTVDEGTETAFADDARKLVAPCDIRRGGKYYSVVKLQIRYEKQKPTDKARAQGSGWLIADDILVTAGHCAFDHTYGLGRAVEVKVYVGYNGRDSVGSLDVQFRQGVRIATPGAWVASDVNRHNDVAFIKVDRPFEGIGPFSFERATPTTGTLDIGVVGYPADKTYKDEKAAQMYEQYAVTTFDLSATKLNMLEYLISTYGGQSGSPVIVKGSNVAIGTHVYGLGTKNSASVIRGQYGNFYHGLRNAVRSPLPDTIGQRGFVILEITGAEDTFTESDPPVSEGFWSVFKKVVRVGSKIASTALTIGAPFLGPVGAPVAAIAGTALRFAGRVAETATTEAGIEGGEESLLTADYSWKPHACRAILNEAALQTVQQMNVSTAQKYRIFQKMQSEWEKKRPYIRGLARDLGPSFMEPALRIALRSSVPTGESEMDNFPEMSLGMPNEESTLEGESSMEGESSPEADMQRLSEGIASIAKAEGETEGWWSSVGKVFKLAVKAAPAAINLYKALTESEFDGAESSLQPHLEDVCHRAVMGEAAFNALMSIPPAEWAAEGFYKVFYNTIKTIGPSVIKLSPGMIRNINPIVIGSITTKRPGRGGGESSFDGAETSTSPSKKRIVDLLDDVSIKEAPGTASDQSSGIEADTTSRPISNGKMNGHLNGTPFPLQVKSSSPILNRSLVTSANTMDLEPQQDVLPFLVDGSLVSPPGVASTK